MAEKQKKIKGTSPIGTILWFKLVKADQKFKKYTADLIVEDSEQIRKIIQTMDDAIEETLKAEKAKAVEKKDFKRQKSLSVAKSKPIEPQLDAEGKETGKYIMRFRMKSEGMNKDKQVYLINPPAIFNGAGKPYSTEEKARLVVFNGSIGQIAFEMSPYALATGDVGVTLRPTAAMIRKIQQADADASQFGFAANEMDSDAPSEFEMEAASEEQSGEADANQDF